MVRAHLCSGGPAGDCMLKFPKARLDIAELRMLTVLSAGWNWKYQFQLARLLMLHYKFRLESSTSVTG